MTSIFNQAYNGLYSLWNQIFAAFSDFRWYADLLDILIVAYIIYKAFVFLRETRSGQLVKGIAVLLFVYAVASLAKLAVLQWILSVVFNSAIVVFAVIFQPEIRRILERVGQTTNLNVGKNLADKDKYLISCIENIGKAVREMSEKRIGALIVFERKTQLGEIINTGTVIDSETSTEMISNIFYPKAPLHDGAVIIRDGRIYAAGCILPLTQSNVFPSELGTRHRAAIGMTENSDAVVLVVSEENGKISIVNNGEIKRDYNAISATEELMKLLVETGIEEKDSNIISALKNILPFTNKDEKDVSKNEKIDKS